MTKPLKKGIMIDIIKGYMQNTGGNHGDEGR